jgi:hypothetical protein
MEVINHFEWGGCERIDGDYYLIGGSGRYQDFKGYGMYVFRASDPTGPFRPDPGTFRLCGNSHIHITWLAAWCRAKDGELLISNYASMARGDFKPWMLPLRKPVVEDGGLRLAWWPGNEGLKGNSIELGQRGLSVGGEDGGSEYDTVWLDRDFDLARGVVVEGTLRAEGPPAGAGGHGPAPAAGFVFDEGPEQSMALLQGIGSPGNRETRIGRLQSGDDGATFDIEDVTGKSCATVTGIEDGKRHAFRLLVRMTFFELYVDDRLVQTFVYRPAGGRLGFIAQGSRLEVTDLNAWQMSLPAGQLFHS